MSEEELESWVVNVVIVGVITVEFMIFNCLLQNLFWLSGLAVSSGILYYLLIFHFKKTKHSKKFKRTQLWVTIFLFLTIITLSVLAEGSDSSDAAIFLVLFLGSNELVGNITEGLEIIEETSNT